MPGWCSPEAVYVARDELLEAYSPPTWAKDALCREYPQSVFFPSPGQSTDPTKAVCARCLVDLALRVKTLSLARRRSFSRRRWGTREPSRVGLAS